MGRPPQVSDEEVITLLQKYIEYFDSHDLPPVSHSVYQQMSTDLNNVWKPQTVYNHVRQNKKNHLQTARERSSLATGVFISAGTTGNSQVSLSKLKRSSSIHEYSLNYSQNENEDTTCDFDDSQLDLEHEYIESKQPEFDLTLSLNEWGNLKPAVNATESQKRRLKPCVWANVLTNAIWTRYAFKCAFNADYSYLRPQLSENDDFFLSFKMHCASAKCGNQLIGLGEKILVDGSVHLKFKCNDTRDNYHEEVKRQLNGINRLNIGKQLLKRRAAPYRDQLIQKHVKFGQSVPYFIPNLNIYRQIKSEAVKESLGLPKKCKINIIDAIKSIFNKPEFSSSLRIFNIADFGISFCTKEQIYVFKEYCRIVKNSVVCLDATGKVVKKFELSAGRLTGHIYLYTVTINFNGVTTPVLQLLTERHDELFISFWLKDWFNLLNIQPPKTAVTDQGRALMLAICTTYNNMTLKEYIDKCFLWAMQPTRSVWPANTMIRLDVAHFIKTITLWDSIKSISHPAVKSFYIRIFALMLDCQSVQQFQNIFQMICVLATHKNNNTIVKIPGKKEIEVLQIRKQLEEYLMNCHEKLSDLTQFVSDDEIVVDEEKIEEIVENQENTSGTLTHQWIKKLISQSIPVVAEPNVAIELTNQFYHPDFIPDLERKGKEFPLWTGAGIPDGKQHASTAFQEGFFSMLDPRIFEGIPLPCSAHRFIQSFLDYINGASTDLAAKLSNFSHEQAEKVEVTDACDTHLSVIEESNLISSQLPEGLIPPSYNFLNDSDFKSTENWGGFINEKMPYMKDGDKDDDYISTNNTGKSTVEQESHEILNDELLLTNTPKKSDKYSSDASITVEYPEETSTPVNNNQMITETKKEKIVDKVAKPSHYFKQCPDIGIINDGVDDGTYKRTKGFLIPNGNICKVLKINGVGISVKNSCPHDSVMQILLIGALEYPHFFAIIKKSKNHSFQFVKQLVQQGVIDQTLATRAQILNDHYVIKKMGRLDIDAWSLDAWDSIGEMMNKLFALNSRQDYNEESAQIKCTCSVSGCLGTQTRTKTFFSINTRKFNVYGFQAFEKSIIYEATNLNIKCRQKNCTGAIIEETILNNQIYIEADVREHPSEPQKNYQLKDFPVELNLDKKYRLIGVVCHQPGHFIAYCRKATGTWIECDSMKDKIKSCQSTKKVVPELFIYIKNLE